MNNKKDKNNKKNRKEKNKNKTWKKILIIVLLIIVALLTWFIYKTVRNGGGMSGMLATVVGHDENTKKNLGELQFLVLGVSTGIDAKLSDTIMVASYNPNTQKASILSIPRDTFTGKNQSKATPSDKLNSIYSLTEDPQKVLKAVNEITRLNLEYYIVIDTDALVKLVDAIGGVDFDVPIDMNYDDPTQDLHIHLKAGQQKLDGSQAEQVVRFRHNNNGTTYSPEYGDNDIGRMKTQREFIAEVLKQTLKPGNIFKIGQFLEIANENVKTNINLSVAKDYVPYAVEFSTENLQSDALPGEPKLCNEVWVYIYNKTATSELIQQLFYPEEETDEVDGEANMTNTSKTANTLTSNTAISTSSKSKSDIKLEILNGSGETKNLEKVVNILKEAGYNVSKTGTTNTTTRTTIVNKKEVKDTILKNIKEELGTGTISSSEVNTSKVDVTIVIGKDYTSK